MIDFVTFIVALVALVLALGSRRRIDNLEQTIGSNKVKEKEPAIISNIATGSTIDKPITPNPSTFSEEIKNVETEGPGWLERFIFWLKDDWLLKLGALLLLIGLGWFASYAFLNNWIGPIGRIALGIFLGLIMLTLGSWRIKKYLEQGSLFLILGSTMVLLTVFAARSIYGLFTPLTALLIMFSPSVFVGFMSVKHRVRGLALSGLILASLAPLLTNMPSPDYLYLFGYLFVVMMGIIWVTFITGWRALTTAGLVVMVFYSLPHLTRQISEDADKLLIFMYVFALLFFVTNTIELVKGNVKSIKADLLTAGGNGLLLLFWIHNVASDKFKSWILIIWMVIFALGAFLIYRVTKNSRPLYVYLGIAIVMLASATAVEFSGPALVIAYSLESAFISIITFVVTRNLNLSERLSLLMFGPVVLSFQHMDISRWQGKIPGESLTVLVLVGFLLLFLGLFYWIISTNRERKDILYIPYGLIGSGIIYAYIIFGLAFDGYKIAIAFAILSALVSLASYIVVRKAEVADKLSLLMILPLSMSLPYFNSTDWSSGVWHKSFGVILFMSLVTLLLGLFNWMIIKRKTFSQPPRVSQGLVVVSSVLLYALLWVTLHAWFENNKQDIASMLSLFTYTVIGLLFYFWGRTRNIRGQRIYGGVILGFVVLRLLFIEVWNMELTGKIITFGVIGVLLISTAFLGRSKSDRISPESRGSSVG